MTSLKLIITEKILNDYLFIEEHQLFSITVSLLMEARINLYELLKIGKYKLREQGYTKVPFNSSEAKLNPKTANK